MTRPSRPAPLQLASAMLGSPRFSSALTMAAVGLAVIAYAVRQTIGWAGFLAVLCSLVVLALASLASQWKEVGWRALLPISLLVFAAWAGLSILWSEYQWATLGGLAYLAAFTILGVYVALVRDTIQIVRAFGDVLRGILVASIVIEIVAGLLIDTPIHLLGITANLDAGGPIQGLLGTRNQLGIVSVIALVTFGTELRTRSVSRQLSVGSLALAAIMLFFTRSPIAWGILLLVLLAGAVLYGLRRVPSGQRRYWQVATLALFLVVAGVAWGLRGQIVAAFNAGGELNYRLNVWQRVWDLVPVHSLEGWGWIGIWRTEVPPFLVFDTFSPRVPTAALNAYLDVWFQLGLVGVVIFVGLLGLTFVRSWLLASRRRSIVFAWPALVLVVLLISGLSESSILIEFGWLAFVVCSVKAARELSWRNAFDAAKSDGTLPDN
ncbi:exopolysaccharide biosynthesis protein [Glaciihabitans arcticus]|uniref:Exopolysaccharide biosynthesis protein n=1 Tax=Glaciihabitans arcticus TaxID=2668039 RepID=A0A4V2JEK9_9MICO|nr:O-antigen ligase family protein [Glaciihabitans arcticus]TBN55969.1 exopolysaccharide biosynthesis protein [Glaciihabitans arcticus]